MNLRRQTGALPLPPRRHAGEHRIAYRSMREDDLPFLAALYRSMRETELARTSWPEPEKQAFIAMQFEAQHRHYQTHYPAALWLIVEQEGTAVGRLYLERWTSEHRIIDVALIPEARGRGIGGAILRDLMEEAANAGKAVSIHVEKENPAMSLYSRLGFVKREDKGVYDLLDWRSDPKVPTGCT